MSFLGAYLEILGLEQRRSAPNKQALLATWLFLASLQPINSIEYNCNAQLRVSYAHVLLRRETETSMFFEGSTAHGAVILGL
jgi:hypothetical protein